MQPENFQGAANHGVYWNGGVRFVWDGVEVTAREFMDRVAGLDEKARLLDSALAETAHFKAEYNRVREERDKAERYFTDTMKEREELSRQVATLKVEKRDTDLQIEALRKALYEECRGIECGPECAGGGYRKCSGCDRRAKAAYGPGWGEVTDKQVGRCPGCDSTAHPGDCETRG